MKNVHVFVPVFLYAVTMLIFQIKIIISSEKWCNYIVPFFLKMPKIWVGRTTVNGEKQEDGLTEKRNASASRWYNNCSDDEKSSCFGKVMRCLLQNQKRCVTFLMCWLKCHAISIDK